MLRHDIQAPVQAQQVHDPGSIACRSQEASERQCCSTERTRTKVCHEGCLVVHWHVGWYPVQTQLHDPPAGLLGCHVRDEQCFSGHDVTKSDAVPLVCSIMKEHS